MKNLRLAVEINSDGCGKETVGELRSCSELPESSRYQYRAGGFDENPVWRTDNTDWFWVDELEDEERERYEI